MCLSKSLGHSRVPYSHPTYFTSFIVLKSHIQMMCFETPMWTHSPHELPHRVSNIHLVHCLLFTITRHDLFVVSTPESLATTLPFCKQHLQTILGSPQQLLHHNGKLHIQNVSVALRSWWDSDRMKMIIDPVQQCLCLFCLFLSLQSRFIYCS